MTNRHRRERDEKRETRCREKNYFLLAEKERDEKREETCMGWFGHPFGLGVAEPPHDQRGWPATPNGQRGGRSHSRFFFLKKKLIKYNF
jgi:hypothetical protein